MKKKETYLAPAIEIIEVENEGVMAASVKIDDYYGNGGSAFGNSTRRSSANPHTTSTLGELEDMINDIFTVKKR